MTRIGTVVDTVRRPVDNPTMFDLNDLRVFEKVAAMKSFSSAARTLGLPRSSVSRCIARLEEELDARLFQRTTREVALTPTGEALHQRCSGLLSAIGEAVSQVRSSTSEPRGHLRVTTFAGNRLRQELPAFLRLYPNVSVSVDVSSETRDLLTEADVAIRLGPMPDSGVVATRIGSAERVLCVSPTYLERRGTPESLDELPDFDTVDMPGSFGRPRCWTFNKNGETKKFEIPPRLSVNEESAIKSSVINGAGIGILFAHCGASALASGELVTLFSDWSIPPVDVNLVFASKRGLSPNVRAFVDFMKERLGVPHESHRARAGALHPSANAALTG
jgi:DNA-binding transcriptional LysR family regulator